MNNNEIPDGELMKYKYRNGNNIRPVFISCDSHNFIGDAFLLEWNQQKWDERDSI